jgi:hypothetical protein
VYLNYLVIMVKDYTWHLDKNINPIENWTRDSILIFRHECRRTPEGFYVSPKKPQGQGFIAANK